MSGANTTEPTLTEVDSGRLPPLPRSNLNKNPPHRSQRSERLVLVRDPPRERLARARSLAGPEETLLVSSSPCSSYCLFIAINARSSAALDTPLTEEEPLVAIFRRIAWLTQRLVFFFS